MNLSNEDIQRIQEEEVYRKKVQEEEQYRNQFRGNHTKKGFSLKKLLFLLIIIAPFILAIRLLGNRTSSSSIDTDIGKYAYNKTNGVYRGKIVDRKDCTSDVSFKCFVVKINNSAVAMEVPVVNIDVKDAPPIP